MTMQVRSDRHRTLTRMLTLTLLVALLIAACGGGGNDSGEDVSAPAEEAQSSSRGAAPTMPVARFAAVEGEVDLTKVAESADDATPEPETGADLALGESAYGKLCAECHGDAGEGVADKGEAIVGLVDDEAALIDLLRTGGGYGNEHIFAPIKISDDGIASLYAYVLTLSGE